MPGLNIGYIIDGVEVWPVGLDADTALSGFFDGEVDPAMLPRGFT